jgi:hypothetical protein
MSATTIEASRIAGALKCMDALRKLERDSKQSIADDRVDRTVEEYFGQRLADVRAVVAALGPMVPEHEGAIATLAEYIHSAIDGGAPNISPGYWLPLAAMTDAEQVEMIGRMEAENAEIDAQCNVISLAERRAAT